MQLTASIIESEIELQQARQAWRRVYEQSAYKPVSLTFEWVSLAWPFYRDFDPRANLFIVVLKSGDAPVAFLPLMTTQRRFKGLIVVREVQFVLHDWSDYSAFLIVRGYEEQVLNHLVDCILPNIQWDSLLLKNIPGEWPAWARFKERVEASYPFVRFKEKSRYHRIPTTQSSFSDYWEGLQPAFRQNIRTAKNRLSRRFSPDSVRIGRTPAWNDAFISEAKAMYGRRLTSKNRKQQHDRPFREFVAQYCSKYPERVQAYSFEIGGVYAGSAVNLLHADQVHYWFPAINERFAEFSPGHLLLYKMIGDAFEEGKAAFDFMRGDSAYKKKWAITSFPAYQLHTYNTKKTLHRAFAAWRRITHLSDGGDSR